MVMVRNHIFVCVCSGDMLMFEICGRHIQDDFITTYIKNFELVNECCVGEVTKYSLIDHPFQISVMNWRGQLPASKKIRGQTLRH